LNKNCATCHRPGQIAPFSLLTYQDAATHAMEIAWATSSRYMPPWKAAPGYGEFKNPRQLNEQEIALIQRWLSEGTPEGNPADLPPTPKFPDGDWQLGKPDLILKMPQPYKVEAIESDRYQCFVLPLNLPNDLYVRAIDVKPGNSKAVHHAVLFQTASDEAVKLDAQDPDVGYQCFDAPKSHQGGHGLYTWTPGMSPEYLPNGIARVIPKGSDLILENHYPAAANEMTDRSSVAIYLAKRKPQKLAVELPFAQYKLDIPAGEKRHKITLTTTIPVDLQIIDVMPHMHFLGREMKVTATLPDGTVKPMIWIKDWDFNWQMEYQYKEPLNLPKGTNLEMIAYFDNSSDNPHNPNYPPKRVTWGMNTTDEMFDFMVTIAVEDDQEKLKQIDKFYSTLISGYEGAVKSEKKSHPQMPSTM
ncbi:hypothetical protein, partial [Aerosakkonema funiforme]|uniref:hypothetical protein n=1 Tax=Aerosakkonema funiforme TaxID=1246630 RepID=UPI0035B8175F